MSRLMLVAGLFLLGTIVQASDNCKFEALSSDQLVIAGAQLVKIEAGAGFLRVKGVPGTREVMVEAQACATNQNLLDNISFRLRPEGDRLVLKTELPKTKNNHYAYLNLTVTVPEGIDMDIVDSSGSLTVKNIGSLRVVDGSGSIDIDNADGSVIINDGSGSLAVSNVGNHLKIEDGSGSIQAKHIGGSVLISDSSGSISVKHVGGAVNIVEDGSGSISVADISGDFVVSDDGSGGISHKQVAGKVTLPN